LIDIISRKMVSLEKGVETSGTNAVSLLSVILFRSFVNVRVWFCAC